MSISRCREFEPDASARADMTRRDLSDLVDLGLQAAPASGGASSVSRSDKEIDAVSRLGGR
jgi:hypothetical protein